MARVFLHIGAHKTGTTYLQNLFHLNRELLEQAGIHYPHIGPNTAHHALAASWIDLPDVPSNFYGVDGPDGLWQKLTDRYAGGDGTLFLSAENLSRCYPQEVDMVDLAQRLSGFDEVRVIYTMRAQAELVQSLWLQLAKSERVLSVHKYVRSAIEQRRAVGVRIDHGSVHTALLRGFAPEQIQLLDYQQIRQAPGGIGQVFLDLLDAGLRMDQLALPPREEANISPEPLDYWLASQIAGQVRPVPQLLGLVSEIIQANGQPTTLLARYEYTKLRNRYAPGNATLAEQVQLVQPGFGFIEPKPPENLLYRDEFPQHLWIEIAAALHGSGAGDSKGGTLVERTRRRLTGRPGRGPRGSLGGRSRS